MFLTKRTVVVFTPLTITDAVAFEITTSVLVIVPELGVVVVGFVVVVVVIVVVVRIPYSFHRIQST